MKKRFLLLFLILLSNLTSFSQKEDFLTKKILKTKPNDIFKLKSIIKTFSNVPLDTLKRIDFLSQKEDYKVGRIGALYFISQHYKKEFKHKQTLLSLEKALEIAKEINEISPKIFVLNNIGATYKNTGNIKNAMKYYQLALFEVEKINEPSDKDIRSKSNIQTRIGDIYLLLKQYNLALEVFEESLKLENKINRIEGIARSHLNIGFTHENLGDLEKASKNYKKSLNLYTKINSLNGTCFCNNFICSILIKKGAIDEAIQIAKKTKKETKQLKNKICYEGSIAMLGWAYLKKGNKKEAETLLNEAVMLSDKHNYVESFIKSSFHLSELYSSLGNDKKAFFHYKKAIEQDNKISGKQNLSYINNLIDNHNSNFKKEQLKKLENLENKVKIQNYQVSRNRDILIIALVSFALLGVALYSIYRQRLVNNDRSILKLEQQALQAQMNPHFIFNALNSIKLYIIKNDQKQAVYYLNKFSKLIRNILDVSKVKYVNLEEELKTMELYMSIENIRFNNEITYTQNIHPNLNLETIKLPPLVLQPFIENAIWHGLSSKKLDKAITLTASKVSKNIIEISITDNGIGREAAIIIKKNKNKSLDRKSVGIDLTIERLETFSNEFIHEFSLKYYDLKDESGKALGTKASLRIPLS